MRIEIQTNRVHSTFQFDLFNGQFYLFPSPSLSTALLNINTTISFIARPRIKKPATIKNKEHLCNKFNFFEHLNLQIQQECMPSTTSNMWH